MPENKINKNPKLNSIFTLMAVIVLSCSLLIVVNNLTIKILSASRAYVNGESHYSKAQKEATRHLTTYLFTKDSTKFKLFNKELSVPKGDAVARIELQNNNNLEVIKSGLEAGRNDKKDLDDMIWLFKNFEKVSFFKNALDQWSAADKQILELSDLGNEIHQKISVSPLTFEQKQAFLQKINNIATNLTKRQRQFSDALGEGTRSIKSYLLLINIFLTLIIIGSVSIYYTLLINKLNKAMVETEIKNKNLIIANKELDKFVYSASHDLRAPISSLKGLIEVVKLEDDIDQIQDYMQLMEDSLNKQDQFIKDIIDYSRNKKRKEILSTVSLSKVIQEAIAQNQFIKKSNEITIKQELDIDEIKSDELKLKIILNNLLSNAIKYSDKKKDNPFVLIKTYGEEGYNKIEIEDNGIGIDPKYHGRLFEMFFVPNNNHNNGSGLGLYIVKEAVENLDGQISLTSEVNSGTKITITIPKTYES
jgi:signal transduction histidine kinase